MAPKVRFGSEAAFQAALLITSDAVSSPPAREQAERLLPAPRHVEMRFIGPIKRVAMVRNRGLEFCQDLFAFL
jgi:hypothetical protein